MQISQKTGTVCLKVYPKDKLGVLRTGAAHPLLNFSGCGRTRRTRSNGAPVLFIKIPLQF